MELSENTVRVPVVKIERPDDDDNEDDDDDDNDNDADDDNYDDKYFSRDNSANPIQHSYSFFLELCISDR